MSTSSFEIDDELSFAENVEAFSSILEALDSNLGPALTKEIMQAVEADAFDREAVLDRLLAALKDTSK